jgi:hypothetical protein
MAPVRLSRPIGAALLSSAFSSVKYERYPSLYEGKGGR